MTTTSSEWMTGVSMKTRKSRKGTYKWIRSKCLGRIKKRRRGCNGAAATDDYYFKKKKTNSSSRRVVLVVVTTKANRRKGGMDGERMRERERERERQAGQKRERWRRWWWQERTSPLRRRRKFASSTECFAAATEVSRARVYVDSHQWLPAGNGCRLVWASQSDSGKVELVSKIKKASHEKQWIRFRLVITAERFDRIHLKRAIKHVGWVDEVIDLRSAHACVWVENVSLNLVHLTFVWISLDPAKKKKLIRKIPCHQKWLSRKDGDLPLGRVWTLEKCRNRKIKS